MIRLLKNPDIMKPIKKSHIRETLNLLTNADSRTDTILEKLHDYYFILYRPYISIFFSLKKRMKKIEEKKIIIRGLVI